MIRTHTIMFQPDNVIALPNGRIQVTAIMPRAGVITRVLGHPASYYPTRFELNGLSIENPPAQWIMSAFVIRCERDLMRTCWADRRSIIRLDVENRGCNPLRFRGCVVIETGRRW